MALILEVFFFSDSGCNLDVLVLTVFFLGDAKLSTEGLDSVIRALCLYYLSFGTATVSNATLSGLPKRALCARELPFGLSSGCNKLVYSGLSSEVLVFLT